MIRTMNGARGIVVGAAFAAVAGLSGCAQAPKPLYLWEDFPRVQYQTLLHEGNGPEVEIRNMQAHAEKAKATNSALPPGFRAHLGMLYLRAGDADSARRMWEAEKAAFPESAPFMNTLLKRLDPAPKVSAPSQENPA